MPLRNSAVWFWYLWSIFYLLSLLLPPFICCANKWYTEWLCLAGVNPCLSVHCQAGEECDINKFGIARCECPPQCEPIMRPVCGQDGRTYESLCEMRRASCMQKKLIEVKHTGSCGKTTTVEMWPTIPWYFKSSFYKRSMTDWPLRHTRVGTLIVATIYLQLIQNRYMFRSFTVLHCSHQHCVQPVASDVEVVGYL